MNDILKLPFYTKLTLTLLGLIVIVFIFYIDQDILIPETISFLFGILLYPIVPFFKLKIRFPNICLKPILA